MRNEWAKVRGKETDIYIYEVIQMILTPHRERQTDRRAEREREW